MIKKDSRLRLIKKTCALILGIALAFSQTGISALAESVEVFEMTQSCGDVIVSINASEGVFPEGAYFEVSEVSDSEEECIADAVSEIRDGDEQVATSYIYDITVYDKDGNEIEPNTEYGQVSVTFSMNEVSDSNLQTKVYHVEGSEDSLSAKELEANVSGDEVTVLTDGFSYYVVEFVSQDPLRPNYLIKRGDRVTISKILDACGISIQGEINDVSSNNTGLNVEMADSTWYVSASDSFTSNATLQVDVISGGAMDTKYITVNYKSSESGVTYLEGTRQGYIVNICDNPNDFMTSINDNNTLGAGFYYVPSSNTVDARITVEGTADNPTCLILGSNIVLTVNGGIHVPQDHALRIYTESEQFMGTLVASCNDNNKAGIGGDNNESAGVIQIDSGIIEATGGNNAAGIGGGNHGSGGTITVNGGKVIAHRGAYAAGIGGGLNGSSGSITINGGTVNTPLGGSVAGAGIGSGRSANSSNADSITINAGTVTAVGSGASAGIGGGNIDAGVAITINGGTINATGGIDAAGIGGGSEATNTAGKITIAGGTINATGGANAAGIGGGRDGNAGEIKINGGKINATGNNGGAGIGGGINGKNDVKVTIAGGDITATGNGGGAGIGGGSRGIVGEIKIDGGKINATGNGGGAGIGGGKNSDVAACKITINDGTISAKSDTGKGIFAGDSSNIVVAPKFGDISFENGEIEIPNSGGKKPTSNTNPNNSERKDNEDDNSQQSAVPAEPLMKSSANNGGISGICTYAKQGPLCAALFKSATPAGFKEAFSFNLNLDKTGKAAPNHDIKVGKLVLNIPKQYQKAGRTFAIIGIDKSGKTKIFYDSDSDDKIFTANISISGYAFSLIYSDSIGKGKRNANPINNDNGDYVVKQGDSLSSIARKLKKSVRYLAQNNNIENPDRLSVGQVLKY